MGLKLHSLSCPLVLLLKETMKYTLLEDKCPSQEISSVDRRQNNSKTLITFWKPLNSSP